MEIDQANINTKLGRGGGGGGVGAPMTSSGGRPGLSPLSETLWRERSRRGGDGYYEGGDVSARLTWKEVTVTVTLSKGESQRVLEELTGYAEPGSFTALMGPSGSGKSSLLDALAGRLATNAFLSGSVLLNGRKANLSFGTAVSSYTPSLAIIEFI